MREDKAMLNVVRSLFGAADYLCDDNPEMAVLNAAGALRSILEDIPVEDLTEVERNLLVAIVAYYQADTTDEMVDRKA